MSYPGHTYQKLFDHLHNEHGLVLLQTEMDEIIRIMELANEFDGLPSYDRSPDDCPHLNTFIKTTGIAIGCENTVIACLNCGKHLTEPKTDC